jgi:hypothetical protein
MNLSYLWTYDLYGPVRKMLLMRANPFRGPLGGGWTLEIETFLGPVEWHRSAGLCHVPIVLFQQIIDKEKGKFTGDLKEMN